MNEWNRREALVGLVAVAGAAGAAQTVRAQTMGGEGDAIPYILPQIAFGGGWYTALYLSNTTSSAVTITLKTMGVDGSELRVTLGELGTNSTFSVTIDPLATRVIELPDSGSLTEGWIEATLPSTVIGYGVFRQTVSGRADQEAVVPLSPASSTLVKMVYDDIGFTTGVAIVNPSAVSVTNTVTAYDPAGTPIGTGTLLLPARSKSAVSLRSISGLSAIAGTRGYITVAAGSGAVSVLGLRFGTGAFTSIPATHI